MPRKSLRKAARSTAHYRVPAVRRLRKQRTATMEQRAYSPANMAAPPGVRATTRASGEGDDTAVTPTSEVAAQSAPAPQGGAPSEGDGDDRHTETMRRHWPRIGLVGPSRYLRAWGAPRISGSERHGRTRECRGCRCGRRHVARRTTKCPRCGAFGSSARRRRSEISADREGTSTCTRQRWAAPLCRVLYPRPTARAAQSWRGA